MQLNREMSDRPNAASKRPRWKPYYPVRVPMALIEDWRSMFETCGFQVELLPRWTEQQIKEASKGLGVKLTPDPSVVRAYCYKNNQRIHLRICPYQLEEMAIIEISNSTRELENEVLDLLEHHNGVLMSVDEYAVYSTDAKEGWHKGSGLFYRKDS